MKKVFKILGMSILTLFILVVGLYVWLSYFHITEVDQKTSENQEYTIKLQRIGSVPWPHGPFDAQLILQKEGKTIAKKRFTVIDDGLTEYSWDVVWGDEEIAIEVRGKRKLIISMDYEGNNYVIIETGYEK